MSLTYRLIRKSVLNTTTGTREYKYYAKVVTTGRSTLKMIADSIAQKTLVSPVDVRAVIDAMQDDIVERIRQGQIVEVGQLGNFHLVIESRGGTANPEEWTPSLIRRAKVEWISVKGMRDIAKGVTFTRWHNLDTQALIAAIEKTQNDLDDAQHALLSAQRTVTRLTAEVVAATDPATANVKKLLLEATQAQVAVYEAEIVAAGQSLAKKKQAYADYKKNMATIEGVDPHEEGGTTTGAGTANNTNPIN